VCVSECLRVRVCVRVCAVLRCVQQRMQAAAQRLPAHSLTGLVCALGRLLATPSLLHPPSLALEACCRLRCGGCCCPRWRQQALHPPCRRSAGCGRRREVGRIRMLLTQRNRSWGRCGPCSQCGRAACTHRTHRTTTDFHAPHLAELVAPLPFPAGVARLGWGENRRPSREIVKSPSVNLPELVLL